MAGEAKTAQFLLADATVMIGPMADLLSLNPTDHSIGLVKNFAINAEPSYTELTQGIRNEEVYSVMTGNVVSASMEVYEYTSKNLAYGLGLDGADYTLSESISFPIKTAIAATEVAATFDSATDVSSKFPIGSWVAIQSAASNKSDNVHIAKVTAVSYAATVMTVTFTGYPVTNGFVAGDKIFRVMDIPIGSKKEQPFLAAKIVGIMPEGNEPLTLLIPKLRITKGFHLAFQGDNFGNLPYEFKPYAQVATDPNYTEFGTTRAIVFRT